MNHIFASVLRWFDDEAGLDELSKREQDRLDFLRIIPFLMLHIACLGVIWTGWSKVAVGTAIGLYVVRMLGITGAYHRYFSHRTYKMSRFWQFVFAVIANSSAQRGPLWWAANHRHHHRFTDKPEDIHSPLQKGFLWSHVLWILTPKFFATNKQLVKSWMKFPELVFLNRFSTLVPLILLFFLYLSGELLRIYIPSTGTSGAQMVVWGFFISTVVLFHATATINSLDHMIGRRRYNTPDTSRNNWLLALLTFGEGWHNNHHHYPISTRQGFFWWELDITYYVLVFLSWLGVVNDLTPLPEQKRTSNLISVIEPGPTPM
jgi:stearoyl-CoA desaturase (delta-9 desaturase)